MKGVYERVKGSGIWWIHYHDASGRRRREKAGTKGMAFNLYRKRKVEALQGKKLPETIRRKAILVRDLLDDAAAHVRQHYSTQRIAAQKGEPAVDSRHPLLAAALGSKPADSITPQEIERVLTRLAEEQEWAPATSNRYKAFLSLAYRLGVANGKVGINPARLVRSRREDNARLRWLSPDEETLLRQTIRDHWKVHEPEFDLALNTGMRAGEQYKLTWDNVDLKRRQLALYRTKNKHPRYVPLNRLAMDALTALQARSGGSGPVILRAERRKDAASQKPRHWFEDAVRRAGLPDFTWHCLRHTFASRLVMAGVDIRTVQELMGHRTLAMTCRYAHLAPQHQLQAVERLADPAAVATATKTATGGFGPAKAIHGKSRQLI
ncbi:MAG: tyrosine-type recombinase/integrase [Terriglobales bacterium]